MRYIIAALVAAVLLVGCSQQTQKPQDAGQQPPTQQQPSGQGQQSLPPNQNQTEPPNPNSGTDSVQPSDKTDQQVQVEIKAKLGRLTVPQTGYVLPVDANGNVQGVTTLAEVTELLRKKGYSQDLAAKLTQAFYRAHPASGTSAATVTILATDGYPGVFNPQQDATFTRKNKWIWIVEQKHPHDELNGAHVATYEVEMLKDGSYRLNNWTIKRM